MMALYENFPICPACVLLAGLVDKRCQLIIWPATLLKDHKDLTPERLNQHLRCRPSMRAAVLSGT